MIPDVLVSEIAKSIGSQTAMILNINEHTHTVIKQRDVCSSDTRIIAHSHTHASYIVLHAYIHTHIHIRIRFGNSIDNLQGSID